MELAPGTMVTANVRLDKPMAQGGMGSVWLADHLGLDAKVAVKFIASELVGRDPTLRERFKREASICARLRSVHVVQTFDHGVTDDGTPYIVMELLQGRTYTDMVERMGPRSPREVGVILSQVGKVLHRAHELGIAHRDIKPDNIFILDDDYELFVKVLDFGIAKTTQSSSGDVVTKTGAIVGSPEFMSPEQAINSKDVDHRTDLFSLAVVAYYGLTGALPFDEDEERPFWIQLTSGEHKPVSTRRPGLSTDFDAWFVKALAPKPQDRFQTARELADSFGQLVERAGAGPITTLSSSEESQPIEAVAVDEPLMGEQDTIRMRVPPPPPPRRRRPPDAGAMRAKLGSAPTLHASDEPPREAPPPNALANADASARLGALLTPPSGSERPVPPPWSMVPPPAARPTWVVVVVSLGAILAVVAAVTLLARM